MNVLGGGIFPFSLLKE